MKKKLLVSAIPLMLFFTASAQQFGVYGNMMLSKQHTNHYTSDFFLSSSFGTDYYWRNDAFIKQTLSLVYERKGENTDNRGVIAMDRINYITLKYLFRMGNSNLDFQIGPYIGRVISATSVFYGRKDNFYWDSLYRFDVGFSTNVNQYLFALDKISFHLRAEANYGISSTSNWHDYITFRDHFDRNLTCCLGLALRWNKEKLD
jgi:hypothetical protein